MQRTASPSRYFWCSRRSPAHQRVPQPLDCIPGQGLTKGNCRTIRSHRSNLMFSRESAMMFDGIGVLRRVDKDLGCGARKGNAGKVATFCHDENAFPVVSHSEHLHAISHNRTIQGVRASPGAGLGADRTVTIRSERSVQDGLRGPFSYLVHSRAYRFQITNLEDAPNS